MIVGRIIISWDATKQEWLIVLSEGMEVANVGMALIERGISKGKKCENQLELFN